MRWSKFVAAVVFSGVLAALCAAEEAGDRVLFLGDVHYDAKEYHPDYKNRSGFKRNLEMWEGKSQELLRAAAAQGERDKVGMVVQLGDIIQGDADTLELQEQMLRKAFSVVKSYFPGLPLAVVTGNHDIHIPGGNDNGPVARALLPLVASELKMPKLADGNFSFRRGKDLFIAVDLSVWYERNVKFVEKVLSENKDARYVFLLTHFPLFPASVKVPLWLLRGNSEIAAMLEKRKAVIFAAHTHVPSVVTRTTPNGKLLQVVVSSMGSSWDPERLVAPKVRDWEAFSAAVKRIKPRGMNKKIREMWPKLEASGTYTYQCDFKNSGFVVLDADDSRVEIRVYTDASGKPAQTLTLFGKNASDK